MLTQAQLSAPKATEAAAAAPADKPAGGPPAPSTMSDKHHPLLLSLLSEQLGCSPADIVDFEINLCDVQPGVLGGALEEFVYVGRLDNLASCYTALQVRRGGGEGRQVVPGLSALLGGARRVNVWVLFVPNICHVPSLPPRPFVLQLNVVLELLWVAVLVKHGCPHNHQPAESAASSPSPLLSHPARRSSTPPLPLTPWRLSQQ
jgi:hypothetical protein